MGLDMYIMRTRRTSHSISELSAIRAEKDLNPATPSAAPFLPLWKSEWSESYDIFHEAAYWRKFNALHAWFVDNVQGGVDNCGLYEITRENIESVLAVLRDAYTTRDAYALQPRTGFFFGSPAVDNYYWKQVGNSILTLQELLDEDWSSNRYFYQASW